MVTAEEIEQMVTAEEIVSEAATDLLENVRALYGENLALHVLKRAVKLDGRENFPGPIEDQTNFAVGYLLNLQGLVDVQLHVEARAKSEGPFVALGNSNRIINLSLDLAAIERIVNSEWLNPEQEELPLSARPADAYEQDLEEGGGT